MVAVERKPSAASFAVVRRGFDSEQVNQHLRRLDAEMKILAADRAAAVEQSAQLGQQLEATRRELGAARAEVERLNAELRALAGAPDTVESMSERLQVMRRLAQDEFGEMRAVAATHAAAHAAEIIAAVGQEAGQSINGAQPNPLDGSFWAITDVDGELDRLRREAAQERARLDEEAVARRAQADEEFRTTLVLRCREAMVQLAALQTESLLAARRVLDEADEQAKNLLADARETVRRTIDDAQQEVDHLHALRERLAHQLDTSRQLLDRALPEPPAPDRNGGGGPDTRNAGGETPAIPTAEYAPSPPSSAS